MTVLVLAVGATAIAVAPFGKGGNPVADGCAIYLAILAWVASFVICC